MPIGVGRFSEDAMLLKRQDGEFTYSLEDPTGYKEGETIEIPIKVVTSPPFFRGIFEEEREVTEANLRVSGRLIFFVEPGIPIDSVKVANITPAREDRILYQGEEWMVQSVWAASDEGHSEVLCQRQPRENRTIMEKPD